MSKLITFFNEIKELFGDRSKSVTIRRFLYDRLHLEAGGDEKEIERLVNSILAEKFNEMEEELQEQKEKELHDLELNKYYTSLDQYLYATLNRNIKIGITNRLVGYEHGNCNYKLIDYELSRKYQYLTLELERNGERYPIAFEHIEDIKFSDGDTLKTWIYMQHPLPTWRFYLDYDRSIDLQDINSGRLKL